MFKRIFQVIKANFSSFSRSTEDPEKILQASFSELQTSLAQLRQGIAAAIATQKRTERQVTHAQSHAEEWYRRAQLALQQDNEGLARAALTKRQIYLRTAITLSEQIEQYKGVIDQLKQDMRNLELKIAELKAKKDMYIARSRSAEARYRLEEMLNGISAVSSLDLWKRMEEKVTQIEADTEVLSLTRNDELAKKFATLESIKDVDTELSAMKTRIFPVDK